MEKRALAYSGLIFKILLTFAHLPRGASIRAFALPFPRQCFPFHRSAPVLNFVLRAFQRESLQRSTKRFELVWQKFCEENASRELEELSKKTESYLSLLDLFKLFPKRFFKTQMTRIPTCMIRHWASTTQKFIIIQKLKALSKKLWKLFMGLRWATWRYLIICNQLESKLF